jgi:hypothetical protein
MTDFLKGVDSWFLILAVVTLGGYFLFSIKQLFNGLQKTLDELKSLIKELFENRNTHETRITALETRCNERHTVRSGHDPREHD